mgnify:CR=1 FL=1
MEGVADETGSTGTLGSVIGRRADGIFTAKELLAWVLANVHIIRPVDADGIRGAHVVVEALVGNHLTTDGEIIRTAGVSFQTGTRHKVVVGLADGIRTAQVGRAPVDAGLHAVLVQLTDLLGAAVGV